MLSDPNNSNKPVFEPYWYGRYLLLEQIGVGGMAEVFRARSFGVSGFVKELAIKKLLSRLVDDQEFVDMFIDEAKLMAALTHANVLQVFDLGITQGHYYIAMEFIHGKDLLDLLAMSSRKRKRIPPEIALHIVMEMLRGLHYTHNATDVAGDPLKIVHRDISPSNIMLTYSGGVKVGDFGIAKSMIQSRSTQVGVQKGKLGYMSPEQVTGQKIDHRSDVFAAGVILYETLTMTRLFKAKNDLDVMLKIRDLQIEDEFERTKKRLDETIREIIKKALARKPKNRYQTADDFRDALNDYCFHKKYKPSANRLTKYLKNLFKSEIEKECSSRLQDPIVIENLLQTHNETLPVYRYKEPAGPLHGPMNRLQIAELLASRAADDEERVSVENGPWIRLESVSELRPIPRGDAKKREIKGRSRADELETWDAQDRPLTIKKQTEKHDPAIADRLGRLSFARLLFQMFSARVTGRLTVQRKDEWKHLFFVNGVPGVIDSNNEKELLGNFLVNSGVIDEQTRQKVLQAVSNKKRFGDILVSKHILAPNELFSQLNKQLEEKLLNLFTWPEAVWKWYPSLRSPKGMIALVVDVGALLIKGTSQLSREFIHGFYLQKQNRKLERINKRTTNSNILIPARALSAASLIRFKDSSDEAIQNLVASKRWTEKEAYRVLFLLTELEILHFIGELPMRFPEK